MSLNNIVKDAEAFGCHNLVCLGRGTSRELDYLDLLGKPQKDELKVDAVAEYQSRPVLYIVYGDKARSSINNVVELQHLLANRGERAFLGFLRPGELEILPINLERDKIRTIDPIIISSQSSNAPTFFQSVANGSFSMEGTPESPDYVFDTIYNLMTTSSDELINNYGIPPLDVLSCIGRALFFRFLRDRNIILEIELKKLISPQITSWEECFANAKNSIAVCNWLDETFNGDLLPFSLGNDSFFSEAENHVNKGLFMHMQAILLGWEYVGNDVFQPTLDWNDLDFAHIPIGVLSQVYEQFSRIWDEKQAKATSVFYTPKGIAKYLVEDAFASLPDKKNAKVLDPSCGAGIFLVLSFRALVKAYWEKEGKRPNTRAIQNILYKQIRGFDISESALRLTALSLYITAIELNDSPRPPRSLKFPRPLQGEVLFNQRTLEDDESFGFVLGSLRPDLSRSFDNYFDLVIGNPPWSRLKVDSDTEDQEVKEAQKNKLTEVSKSFTSLTKEILIKRGLYEQAKEYSNPDNDPDLPFIWKATEWAKPGGQIAMALPARIFLKQTPKAQKAFHTILKGIEVTGILNGSNLSDTPVWPGMNQPFMLFFAKNDLPQEYSSFYFASPQFEWKLNNLGLLRIDYNSAQAINVKDVLKYSWLLKALSFGSVLDIEIIKLLDANGKSSINALEKEESIVSGEGYNVSAATKQYPSTHLIGLPDFQTPIDNEYKADVGKLPLFQRETLSRPRKPELYLAPLLIVPKSPGKERSSAKSYILKESVVFSKKYYGYASQQDAHGIYIIAFLHLLTHSVLFRYYILMTDPVLGAERRTFYKGVLDRFPLPRFDKLSQQQKKRILLLSRRLEEDMDKPWDEINSYLFELYNIDFNALQVVNDTIAINWPFKGYRDLASRMPTDLQQQKFYEHLYELLVPSFSISGDDINISPITISHHNSSFISSWIFFSITSMKFVTSISIDEEKDLINQALEEADKTGCSRVFIPFNGRLLVGILAQYRYWTLSRARLCGLHILRKYLDAFPCEEGV